MFQSAQSDAAVIDRAIARDPHRMINYMLPSGAVVQVPIDVCRLAISISFTQADGRVVTIYKVGDLGNYRKIVQDSTGRTWEIVAVHPVPAYVDGKEIYTVDAVFSWPAQGIRSQRVTARFPREQLVRDSSVARYMAACAE